MKVEMTSQAISARLRRVSQLRRLCISLGNVVMHPKNPAAAPAPTSQDKRPGKELYSGS